MGVKWKDVERLEEREIATILIIVMIIAESLFAFFTETIAYKYSSTVSPSDIVRVLISFCQNSFPNCDWIREASP